MRHRDCAFAGISIQTHRLTGATIANLHGIRADACGHVEFDQSSALESPNRLIEVGQAKLCGGILITKNGSNLGVAIQLNPESSAMGEVLPRQEFSIRRATPMDAEAISEVGFKAWQTVFSQFLPIEFVDEVWERQERASQFHLNIQSGQFVLVAVDARGVVIGFAADRVPAALDGFDCEIGGLYVHPDFARAGAGSALVRAMAAIYRSRSAQSMAIHTLADNEIGCAFYTKLGGHRHAETDWRGYPGVWFVWNDLSRFGQ